MYFYHHFLEISNREFEGWNRFCYVVYPLVFALRATPQHVGKAGGLQILRCWGFEVKNYVFTLRRLDSEALRLLQRWGNQFASKLFIFTRRDIYMIAHVQKVLSIIMVLPVFVSCTSVQ